MLAEKGVTVESGRVGKLGLAPAELGDRESLQHVCPRWWIRELVLYESKVMMEYLDERFPHPPLLPVYPVARRREPAANVYRIERGLVRPWWMPSSRRGRDNVVSKSRPRSYAKS